MTEMGDGGGRPGEGRRVPLTVISWRAIVIWAIATVVVTVATTAGLWVTSMSVDTDRAAAQLDALKTGLSIGVGAGGLFALWLATRRQRSTELGLTQQERTIDATIADADERRVTELYTKAAEQIGHDKAPVRLAGIYALERLAQDSPKHRQTIVNVLCAYLRMPFNLVELRDPRISENVLEPVDELTALEEREIRGHNTADTLQSPSAEPVYIDQVDGATVGRTERCFLAWNQC